MRLGLGPLVLAIARIGTLVLCQDDIRFANFDIISRDNEVKNSITPRYQSEARTTAVTPKPDLFRRSKRNIVNLYNLLDCKNPRCDPTSYTNYGCYCGMTMTYSGLAMDGIDKCCQIHDDCFDRTSCRALADYWWSYPWDCMDGNKPLCDKYPGFFAWLIGITNCPQEVCKCDRDLAYCLSQYPCPSYKIACDPQWSIYNTRSVADDDYNYDEYYYESLGDEIYLYL